VTAVETYEQILESGMEILVIEGGRGTIREASKAYEWLSSFRVFFTKEGTGQSREKVETVLSYPGAIKGMPGYLGARTSEYDPISKRCGEKGVLQRREESGTSFFDRGQKGKGRERQKCSRGPWSKDFS